MFRHLMSSHRLMTLRGVEIRVSYALYFFIGILLLGRLVQSSLSAYSVVLVSGMLSLPFFVLLHEMGHALVAMREGVKVRGILLTPLGGIAELSGRIPGPWAEFRIALAGPVASLLAAAFIYPGMIMEGGSYNPFVSMGLTSGWLLPSLAVMVLINLGLGLFNLLPIFPMDGGRLATATAIIIMGPDRGIRMACRLAYAGLALLVACGVGFALLNGFDSRSIRLGLAVVLVGSFLYTTGRQELSARSFSSHYVDANPQAQINENGAV